MINNILIILKSRLIKLAGIFNKNKYFNNIFKTKVIYTNNNLANPVYIYNNILFRSLNFSDTETQSRVCKLSKSSPILNTSRIQSFSYILYKLVKNKNILDTNVLLLGLGGGDLFRYFSQFNNTSITAIENSQEIIDIAKKYFYLNKITKNNNYNIVNADAYEYILNNKSEYNIISVDFFTKLDSALYLFNDKYISSLYRKLNKNGVIVFNVLVSHNKYTNKLLNILYKYFNKNIICCNNPEYYNTIIFCFKNSDYIDYLLANNKDYNINKYIINIKPYEQYHMAEFVVDK